MKRARRISAASVLAIALVLSVTACTRTPGTDADPVTSAPTCSQLLTTAVDHARSESGDIDAVMQALMDNCSNEYEIATEYLSNARDSEFGIESCEELLDYGIRAEAVRLLERDGWCSYGVSDPVAPAPEWPEGGLGWDNARAYAGTVQRVCGPLMSMRQTEDGTFVNLGRDYPSPDRFTVIFWDFYLDPIPADATICGNGEIYLYEGVAQMEMWDPAGLEIWR